MATKTTTRKEQPKNPYLSQAARDRAKKRILQLTDDIADRQDAYHQSVVLGDGSDLRERDRVTYAKAFRDGYITALHDLLPEQMVDALAGDKG